MTISTAIYNRGVSVQFSVPAAPSSNDSTDKTSESVELTDKELVERIQNTEGRKREVAFAMMYTRHYNTAYGVALKFTKNHEEIEEIIQNSFFKVHRYVQSFRGDSAFSTWFYQIVRNTAINYKAHESRRLSASSLEGEGMMEKADSSRKSSYSPEQDEQTSSLEKVAKQGLAQLNPDLRQTLLLVTESGMSYEDVAAITDVPVGTVRSRVFRARQNLAEYIDGKHPGFSRFRKKSGK